MENDTEVWFCFIHITSCSNFQHQKSDWMMKNLAICNLLPMFGQLIVQTFGKFLIQNVLLKNSHDLMNLLDSYLPSFTQ